MGNQDLFVVIVLTGFIFILIYFIKHPTNKSSSSGSGKLMETDKGGIMKGENKPGNGKPIQQKN